MLRHNQLNPKRGASRLLVLLLLAALAMSAVVLMPYILSYRDRMEAFACTVALKKAQNALDEAYVLSLWEEMDLARAEALVADTQRGADAPCPGGGDFHVVVVEGREQPLTVVCGLHETNSALRTRVNAESALRQVNEALAHARAVSRSAPDSLELRLNSRPVSAARAEREPEVHRGTASTEGYEGTVICYIPDDRGGVKSFVYADPEHCARWRAGEGWTEDGAP